MHEAGEICRIIMNYSCYYKSRDPWFSLSPALYVQGYEDYIADEFLYTITWFCPPIDSARPETIAFEFFEELKTITLGNDWLKFWSHPLSEGNFKQHGERNFVDEHNASIGWRPYQICAHQAKVEGTFHRYWWEL